MMRRLIFIIVTFVMAITSCRQTGSPGKNAKTDNRVEKNYEVRLITLDPGHFHAALVQKKMYPQVSPAVHVYAPDGPDLKQHLDRIEAYNDRKEDPTSWDEIVYRGDDFLEKMLSEKAGNVVVLAGNNRKKAEYIQKSVDAGLNVLSDKPMIISPDDFPLLEKAFATAKEKGVLLYDIMTERYEVTTALQKMLSQQQDLFGTLKKGTPESPAVTKESVHHFSKIVSGIPLLRPEWYFDVNQQGEGIVDVTTHLVDLVQWECFPDQILYPSDIEMLEARHWPTVISKEEFNEVTGASGFPKYLDDVVKDGKLNVFANGEMEYRIKGVYAKISVEWKFKAPPGGGDTHYSVMHGTKCDLVIQQGAKEKYVPTLYVKNTGNIVSDDFKTLLSRVLGSMPYDSLSFDPEGNNIYRINVPQKYRVGHEAHFGQVMSKYLDYLNKGSLPDWEINGMITKYFTTTAALKMARQPQ
jgi:predicted dehydrogenase